MKRLTLLVALGVATAGLVAPSVASAVWTHHNHNDLQSGENREVHGEGNASFTSSFGGINCQKNVTATAQLTGGQTTAHVEGFNPTVADCKTTGGLAGCTITAIHVTTLPYLAHIAGTDIQVTGVEINHTLHGFLCPTSFFISGNGVTVIPEEGGLSGRHTTIQSLALAGQLFSSIGPAVTVSGTITPGVSDKNTYGFT